MLKKRQILLLMCIFFYSYMYAETGAVNIFDSLDPHHEYKFTDNGRQSRYRIQMFTPHYAFFVDAGTCSHYECFPNFEMGISREAGSQSSEFPKPGALLIFPEIIFKDENLKEVFAIKGISRDEAGYLYNCYASNWEIYEKGLVLDVLLFDVWSKSKNKVKKVYLELKDDGKYYETDNAENLGRLKKSYSAYDFLDRGVDTSYAIKFLFYGYSIYKMGSGRNIESVLIHNILYYNATETGIEFITPYGCGFFDFKTESMSLVPKEKYIGKEFTYAQYNKDSKKSKEKKKIITEEDFVLPNIKVPLSESDLFYKSKWKEFQIEQRKKEQLLNFE